LKFPTKIVVMSPNWWFSIIFSARWGQRMWYN